MSLTSFLKASSDIRTALRATFPLPRDQGTFPALQARPQTTNFALIGQAFDYLLRFSIQRHNPNAPEESRWVADLQNESTTQSFLEAAHANHQTYLTTGELTDDLLRSCLDLAAIDGLFRAGELRGSLGQADPRDLRDLRNLFALIPQSPFLDGNPCWLNPIFRFPSGADCDLLLGTTLIEIKTTKFSEIKQEYYQQLLGYYLIHLTELPQSDQIESIGIYFSRHGYLWTLPIEALGGKKAFQRFLPVWKSHVDRYHSPRDLWQAQPAQSITDLLAQVDQLSGVSAYVNWLARLSDIDFATWASSTTAPYFALGALEWEKERRRKRGSITD